MINFILCIFFHFKKKRKRERGRKGERKEERYNQRHTQKSAPFFPGTAVATAYSLVWPGLDTQWALRKVLTEWGGAWLPVRELPGDGNPREESARPGGWGWTGAKRERREVGELRKVGPREKRGRTKC